MIIRVAAMVRGSPRHARFATLLTVLWLWGCAHESTWDIGKPYGALVIATLVPPLDMYRVVLQRIDGAPAPGGGARRVPPNASLMRVDTRFDISDARSDFRVRPGTHRLSFTAIVDRKLSPVFSAPPSRLADSAAGELTLTVEEGKRYLIAARVDEVQSERWEPVVYKVENIPNYANASQ